MTDHVSVVLEQLARAKAEIEQEVARLLSEGERLDVAKAALEDPASADIPSADIGISASVIAAMPSPGLEQPLVYEPPTREPVVQVPSSRSGVSAEDVLARLRELGEWSAMKPILEAFPVGKSTIHDRLARLSAQGLVETRGERASTRYRAVGLPDREEEPTARTVTREPERVEEPAEDDDEQPVAIKPKPVAPKAEPRRIGAPARPAWQGASTRRPTGTVLRDTIERMLADGQHCSSNEIATSLVVPVAEVREELQVLFQFGKVRRDHKGRFFAVEELAA